MSGLGAIIMIGSIAIPIMTGAGIAAIDAVILILLGMLTGSALNFAGAATGIGIFGADAVLRYLVPGAIVSVIITLAYIFINIPRGKNAGVSILVWQKILFLPFCPCRSVLLALSGNYFLKKIPN